MDYGGLAAATEVLAELEAHDPGAVVECLKALKHTQNGQVLLPTDPRAAIAPLERAHKTFAQIPAARLLQGNCACDLAAAYGQIEQYARAADYAREAISLLSGVSRFAISEGAAHLTLGICLHRTGDPVGARTCFNLARRIFREAPEGAQYIPVVDQNEALIGTGKRWWQFWKS